MSQPPAPHDPWLRFRTVSGAASKPWPYVAGGVALLLAAAVGFFAALRVRTTPVQLHLWSTLPAIIAVGLLTTAYRLARSPWEVAVGQPGLAVRYRRRERVFDWSQIAWAEPQTQAVTNRKLLAVYGNDGKPLVKLAANLQGFDVLTDTIVRRLTDYPSPHASAVRWRRSRRQAKWMVFATALCLAGAAWTASEAHEAREASRLMQTRGVDGTGVVVRKFIAPDGRTHRIEYRVDGADTGTGAAAGAGTGAAAGTGAGEDAPLHNVEINPLIWATLKTGSSVPVRTVPGRPDIAKLVIGEIDDDFTRPSPTTSLLLSLGLLAMAAFFGTAAVLGFKGIDIKTDPATGKLKVERLPQRSA